MEFVVNTTDLSSILMYSSNNNSIDINKIKVKGVDNNTDKEEDFLDIIYNTTNSTSIFNISTNIKAVGLGNRLGVPYMRAQQNEVEIIINKQLYIFNQSSLGLSAISGVLWDAGLLITDFLIHYSNLYNKYQLTLDNNIISPSLKIIDESLINTDKYLSNFKQLSIQRLGSVLDIGCGIGIAGITALLLDADNLTLTDCIETDCLNINIDKLLMEKKDKVNFIQYDWTSSDIPINLLSYNSINNNNNNNELNHDLIWDTIVCSDVLYDENFHTPFLNFIQKLKFKRLILSYKKRYVFKYYCYNVLYIRINIF
jgi:hypothetical protein